MYTAAQTYWAEFWKCNEETTSFTTGMFGDTSNVLADLVSNGGKTVTCLGYIFFELENAPLPSVNDHFIILKSDEQLVALIKTVDVKISEVKNTE